MTLGGGGFSSKSSLRLICWPFHNGLHGVCMGRGAALLASDEPLREDIEAAGWRLARAQIHRAAEEHRRDDENEREFDVGKIRRFRPMQSEFSESALSST